MSPCAASESKVFFDPKVDAATMLEWTKAAQVVSFQITSQMKLVNVLIHRGLSFLAMSVLRAFRKNKIWRILH